MDAFYILQKAVDLIPLPFPGAGVIWTLAPASRAYSNLSANQTGQDFTAVLLGDISGNWSASPVAASVGTPAGALSLYLRGGRPDAAGFVTASLYLSSSETPVYSIDIALAGVTPPAGEVVLVRLSFRGGGQRGQTSAVAIQRAQINEVDVSGSTQAGQITLDTPPLTDLRAAVTTAGIHLTWGHVGSDAHHYEVWRATNLPILCRRRVPRSPRTWRRAPIPVMTMGTAGLAIPQSTVSTWCGVSTPPAGLRQPATGSACSTSR